MNLFRRAHKEKNGETSPVFLSENTDITASVTQDMTAEQAARIWFEKQFGKQMPESMIHLFRSMIRIEINRKQAESGQLKPTENNKIQEALRLNETKLRNVETSLDKIRLQQDWYRKFLSLSRSLEKEKKELYVLNKLFASVQDKNRELERFETFESIQGRFHQINTTEALRKEIKEQRVALLQEKDKAAKEYGVLEKEAGQISSKRKEQEETVLKNDELMYEASMTQGKIQILNIQEKNENDRIYQWNALMESLKKEIREIQTEIEEKNKEKESLSMLWQEIEAHQRMIEKGEAVLVLLEQYQSLKISREDAQQELEQTLKKQSNQNYQLNKLFTSIKELESQINSLQNELDMHIKSNYGMNGEKLQTRTMDLKIRKQMLQSAQSLWQLISQGYNWIDEKTLSIYRLQKQAENTESHLQTLTTEVNILKGKIEEKKYTFIVSKSQDVIQLRSDLKEGNSCSVCGATHHPYHSDTMLEQSKLLSEMRTELEILEAEYQKKSALLLEINNTYAKETAVLEVEREHLKTIQEMHRQNVAEWKQYEYLDRSFKDCSPSTNQEARKSMLQQLIERTGQDAENAIKELDIFNFHQSHINSINEKISQKETEKNDMMMRFNELNTGCQVWAYQVSHLQERINGLNSRFSELFDELEKTVSVPGWYKLWTNNAESLKIQIQQLLNKNKELISKTQNNQLQLAVLQIRQKMLLEQIENVRHAQEQCTENLEKCSIRKKECLNILQKLTDNKEIKQIREESRQLLEKSIHHESEIIESKNKKQITLIQKTALSQQLEEIEQILNGRISEIRSELDVWMRKYNASHSPVQFSELQQLFSTETDWQETRMEIRKLQMQLFLEQEKVNILQAEMATHQAEEFRISEHSEKDIHTFLVERKENLEQERKNIIKNIAGYQAKLIYQEEKEETVRSLQDELMKKIEE